MKTITVQERRVYQHNKAVMAVIAGLRLDFELAMLSESEQKRTVIVWGTLHDMLELESHHDVTRVSH
jgi:RNase P/RNase MRP subunit p30